MVDILARCPRHPIDFGVWPDPIHHWHYAGYVNLMTQRDFMSLVQLEPLLLPSPR